MQHKDPFLLEQIAEYCEKIHTAISSHNVSDMDDFLKDLELQDLCAFYVLQIGEFANDLSQQFRDQNSEIEWHKAIGFRNIIAHAYGSVDPKVLWSVVDKNIPELYKFCRPYISNM